MIGIIGAMEEEVALLRAEMQQMATEKIASFEFYRGVLSDKDIVVLRSGIGKVQAAIGCTALIEKYAPSLIINTGCAGGVNPPACTPLNFGDAVISSLLVYHDFDCTAFGYAHGQVPGRASAFFEVQERLITHTQTAIHDLLQEQKLPAAFNAVPGLIASGDAFISNSEFVKGLIKIFPSVRAVEMESAAIAHACHIFNVPFIVLRCLSDIAGEESPVTFDEYLPIAARNSSEIVKRLIANF
ncbi:MAG: 5'-methylthioadenosine/adenosylhomocysteine nucleosidase [Spirochaetaceae bacterium]|jgi:adenosylhomocysteine nucleosidase|nr:5'-methylthioadenosine/adenosylhomocysteine nucleosidase [Spirochaetaceae bacterium]